MKKKFFSILGIILVSMVFISCNRIGRGDMKENEEGTFNETISISETKKINIDVAVDDIDISAVKGNELVVKRTCKGNVFGKLSLKKDGDTINLIEEKVKYKLGSINCENKIEIGIPENYAGDLVLKNDVGDYQVEELKLNDVNIDSGVGNLEIEKAEYNTLKVSQGTGDAKIKLTSCGDISIEGGTGDLELDISNVEGDLIYTGGVGDVTISIPNNSPVSFNTESGVGDCSINVPTSGENKYTFEIETGVGDINVIGK